MKVFKEVVLCAVILGTFYACASTNEEANSSATNNIASIDVDAKENLVATKSKQGILIYRKRRKQKFPLREWKRKLP